MAGDTSCSWRFFDFLVSSFLLSEISPLAPRIWWAENLKQENIKSGVFFLLSSFTWPWYISEYPAECLREFVICHHIVCFCHALNKVIPGMISSFSQCVVLLFWFQMKKCQHFRLLIQTEIPNFNPFDIQQNSERGLSAYSGCLSIFIATLPFGQWS